MCLMTVKDEGYVEPSRYKRVTRVRRYEDDPPPRVERSSYYREERVTPSQPPPPTIVEPPPPRAPSVRAPPTARARSVRSTTRSHYVEVDEEARSTSPSSVSSISNARSRHTRKTSSHSRTPVVKPPLSEYSIHERETEFRRERGPSRPRGDDYETYRYVNAPRSEGGGRQSRDSIGRERERIMIEDMNGRTRIDLRR